MSGIDEIKSEIESLTEQKQNVDMELSVMDSSGVISDHGKYNELRERSAQLGNRIAELSASVEAQDSIAGQFEQLDFGDGAVMALRDMCASDDHYQLLSGWLQTYIGNQAQQHATIVASYKSEIAAQEEQISELKGNVEELQAIELAYESLRRDKEDIESKRNAAGEQLAEAKAEIERLTKDNESLRKQLESRPTASPQAEQVDPKELIRRINAAKPGIYNKRWKDEFNRKTYIANLSATGEEVEISWLELGKYREETPEEAERFRQELAQAEAERLAAETLEQGIEVPTLQFPETEHGLAEGNTGVEMAGETVTRAEFEELTRKVERLAFATGFTDMLQEGAA
ncbi:hypothetical protein ACX93W_26695 [Paenibacillus sp. CAU 1782]